MLHTISSNQRAKIELITIIGMLSQVCDGTNTANMFDTNLNHMAGDREKNIKCPALQNRHCK